MDIKEILKKANEGDVDALFQLKRFVKEDSELAGESQNILEKFYYDGNKEHAVGTIILREGITEIKNEEFTNCDRLEKIILPESLTSIGYGAFSGCKSLKEIKFPDNLTTID